MRVCATLYGRLANIPFPLSPHRPVLYPLPPSSRRAGAGYRRANSRLQEERCSVFTEAEAAVSGEVIARPRA